MIQNFMDKQQLSNFTVLKPVLQEGIKEASEWQDKPDHLA